MFPVCVSRVKGFIAFLGRNSGGGKVWSPLLQAAWLSADLTPRGSPSRQQCPCRTW